MASASGYLFLGGSSPPNFGVLKAVGIVLPCERSSQDCGRLDGVPKEVTRPDQCGLVLPNALPAELPVIVEAFVGGA